MVSTWNVPAKRDEGPPSQRELPPEGNHPAVCVAVLGLGTHQRQKYQSQDTEEKELVYLCWELVDEPGRPLVGRDFPVSLHEKAGLRRFAEGMAGKIKDGNNFDLLSLAGRVCLLEVSHEEKTTPKGPRTYLRIEGASQVPRVKGKPLDVNPPEHEPFAGKIEDADDVDDVPDWLAEVYHYGRTLKEWLEDSKEYAAARGDDVGGPEEDGPDGSQIEDDEAADRMPGFAGGIRRPKEDIPF